MEVKEIDKSYSQAAINIRQRLLKQNKKVTNLLRNNYDTNLVMPLREVIEGIKNLSSMISDLNSGSCGVYFNT